MNRTKKLTLCALLVACAVVIGGLERLIPLPITIPGVKLGLSNIAVLLALYLFGTKEGFLVAIIKALVCGSLFWGLSGLIYSVVGTLCAFLCMYLFKKFFSFGITGVSVIGAVAHNFGQLLVMSFMVKNFSLPYYMCVLGLSGVVTGAITGVAAALLLSKLHRKTDAN